ncbi:unnamed protein product [Spirodela intermedia]|uniref:tRNA(adenine(34)) deaminase n=1 Tax=Spirodela intermedia TaxID=51605 RepID=A0A7I8J7V0_SPIIN|nr:unnamed protein product [Spirodela intermedia]CAA6665492.1 unnamed protein product [Spirodela intermedia]
MYSTALALRSKDSFYHRRHVYLSGDRVAEGGSCCGSGCLLGTSQPSLYAAGFSCRSTLASSRFVYSYLLRQATLIRCTPFRIVACDDGGGSAARYRKLEAVWNGDPCPSAVWSKRTCCASRRVGSRPGASGEIFQDMSGLLDEIEECSGIDVNAGTCGAFEDAYVKGKVGNKSYGEKFRGSYRNERDSSRKNDHTERRSNLSSSHQTASSFSSSSAESGSSKLRQRQDRAESSSYYRQNDEIAKKEDWKSENDSSSRRRFYASDGTVRSETDAKKREVRKRDLQDRTTLSLSSDRQSRERHVQDDRLFTGQKESKEELEKVSRTSIVQESSAKETDFRSKKMLSVMKEEASTVDLLEELRRQRTEIEQLRKDYQNLLRTTKMDDTNLMKASSSSNASHTKAEDLEERSSLQMSLLEEVRRQRVEMEQLNANCRKIMRSFKTEDNEVRETNPSKSVRKISDVREESSSSGVNFVEEEMVQNANDHQQTSNYLRQNRQKAKTSDSHETNVGRYSNYTMGLTTVSDDNKKSVTSAVYLDQENQEHNTNIVLDEQNIRYTNLKDSSQKVNERRDIRSTSVETDSILRRDHVTRVNLQKEDTSSAVRLVDERRDQVGIIGKQVIGGVDWRESSQKTADVLEMHKNDTAIASGTQNRVETMVEDQEEVSTSVQHLVKAGREKKIIDDRQVIVELSISKESQGHPNVPDVYRSEAGISSVAPVDQEQSSVSTVNLIDEVQSQRKSENKQATQQIMSRNDSQQRAFDFIQGQTADVSVSKPSSDTRTNEGDSLLVLVQEAKGKRKSDSVEEMVGTSTGKSESHFTTGQRQTLHEFDPVKDDVLESAANFDKSSAHYVEAFLDKMQQKVSATDESNSASSGSSETHREGQPSSSQKQKATVKHKDEIRNQEDPPQHSATSDPTGPSDEVWDVRGASSQEPSPTEEPDDSSIARIPDVTSAPPSTSGAITKRSGRSLWGYVADIFRIGWRTRADPQKPTVKSGTKSSSNESVSSDAWYSGHELEYDEEENARKGRRASVESELSKTAVDKPLQVRVQAWDVELKRRKPLQRNKQVLREEFEEWEDAYRLETEQRTTDEFFMREALMEAKKAADIWEVPVGAVLVQNGKIIARGCNLVEDLRDSTAHAEMICIREASTLLRTWRLAGTTLYVTLEPCPMCAGAILQARIDTIVWGAPNKLLGADGSWVRLFPTGDEGRDGPVHPFHPKMSIRRGVLATECADAMQQFFQLRRKKNKPPPPPPPPPPPHSLINYPTKLLTKMHNIFCMMACM